MCAEASSSSKSTKVVDVSSDDEDDEINYIQQGVSTKLHLGSTTKAKVPASKNELKSGMKNDGNFLNFI